MFKKLNTYLLENHPLVWNTRLINALLILLGVHLLFFAIGYFSFSSPVQLHERDLFENYFQSGFVWIGVLISILILILWMNQYFKQNAFKSHYPKSNGSLYKEFLIIFLISLLSVSQYFSYTYGLKTRVSGLKSTSEISKEVDIVNQAAAFTLQGENTYYYSADAVNVGYSPNNRCLDAPVFDSLVDRDRLLELFVKNKIRNQVYGWTRLDSNQYQRYADSLTGNLYTHPEYSQLLIEHFPERKNWKITYDFQKVKENYLSVDSYNNYTMEAAAATDYAAPVSYNLESIYNFCWVSVLPYDSLKTKEFYARKNYDWLNNHKKDSIEFLLNHYMKLVDEYEIGHRFKDKRWIDYVYNPPYYFVDFELSSPSWYSEANNKVFKKDYVAHVDLVNSLENLKTSKTCVFQSSEYLIIIYVAFLISLLIFTFRITSMRTWVIAVVGSIVVYFVFICIYFLLSMGIFSMNEILASILFLLLVFIFTWLAYTGIFQGKRKLISGVNFIWTIWTFGAIFPILVGLYTSYLNWKYPYNYQTNLREHPHIEWISSHWETLFFINVILIFLYIFLILPIIKKWQAMAEE